MATIYNVWLVDFEFEQMREYLRVLTSSLEDYEQKLEFAYKENELDNMNEAAEQRYEEYLDTFASVLGDFPRRLCSSFLVPWRIKGSPKPYYIVIMRNSILKDHPQARYFGQSQTLPADRRNECMLAEIMHSCCDV